MKPTLDEEITEIAKDVAIRARCKGFDATKQVKSSIYAGIEAWKRQEPRQQSDHFVYQMCPRHIAYPWPSFTATATYVPPPRAVCPICNPPSASLRTTKGEEK